MKIYKKPIGKLYDTDNIQLIHDIDISTNGLLPLNCVNKDEVDWDFLSIYFPKSHEIFDAFGKSYFFIVATNLEEYFLEVICNKSKELEINNKLLKTYERLLDAIPECPIHGKCVPHALIWIEKMKKISNESNGSN